MVHLNELIADLVDPNFDISDHILVECTIRDSDFEGARMGDVLFVKCNLSNVDFYWADFFRTRFVDCIIDNVIFNGAVLAECAFITSKLTKCDFSEDNLGAETDLSRTLFVNSQIIDCLGITDKRQKEIENKRDRKKSRNRKNRG